MITLSRCKDCGQESLPGVGLYKPCPLGCQGRHGVCEQIERKEAQVQRRALHAFQRELPPADRKYLVNAMAKLGLGFLVQA